MAVNSFADLTAEEYKTHVTVLNRTVSLSTSVSSVQLSDDLPSWIDWRDYGYVTEVQYQGECGSCWSFAAAGAIEGQHKAATDALINLSEAQLLDCSSSYGNNGCNGGNEISAYRYVIDVGGIESDAAYPYVPEQQSCKFDSSKIAAKISSYVRVESGSEDALKQAVGTIGPVSIAMDASHESFGYYAGGIYDEPACSSTDLTHAMLAVGYSWTWIWGEEYWIVKNSWGTDWGDEGYIFMSMNKDNQCGIASSANYPVV